MRGFLANTDPDWFDFLSKRDDAEVNFWTPSPRQFKAISPGEPLLFRLKSPRNRVGGFGVFSRWDSLPDWYAWEVFREANGASDYPSFRARLDRIRQRNAVGSTVHIGAIVLAAPVFLPEHLWVPLPTDWHMNIVSGKGYDLTTGEGMRMWAQLLEAAAMVGPPVAADVHVERYGTPYLVRPRKGQKAFQLAVRAAYDGACAVCSSPA